MDSVDRAWILLDKWEKPGLPNHPWLHELVNTQAFGRIVRTLKQPVEMWGGWKRRDDFEEVEKFCLFVGHARSGSSLVASLVDAHAEIVIAHELDVLQSILDGVSSKKRLFYQLLARSRWFVERNASWTGYNYAVPSQHKGEYSSLKVIGDKRAGVATTRLRRNPDLLSRLREIVGVPVYLIHIKRHPLDNISTLARNNCNGDIERAINRYFKNCQTVKEIKEKCGKSERWLDVYQEDIIEDTAHEVKKISGFLGLGKNTEYEESCKRVVYSSPTKSRKKVTFTDEQKIRIKEKSYIFSTLDRYTI